MNRRYLILLTVGAVLLRLTLLWGRGDYVAFDEGWYLILGENLWSGHGYTLSGLQHVALSPLFPILAGGLGRTLGNPVWAGRIVAAVSSGLLVIPSWYIVRPLAATKVARVGILLVAVLPSLAPFVVPYWIGWDLWVGAEPLLHLFLYSGIAFFINAWRAPSTTKRMACAIGCGISLGLAYLARPEAIAVFGLLGVMTVVFSIHDFPARMGRVVLCGVAFVVVAGPYWVYLHDSLGRWAITGRGVELTPGRVAASVGGASRDRGSNRIESMLWEGDASPYLERLYGLNASGTALAANYWGVPPPDADEAAEPPARTRSGTLEGERPRAGGGEATGAGGEVPSRSSADAALRDTPSDADALDRTSASSPWLLRYARALGVVVPWYMWAFAIAGLAAPGRILGESRRLHLELMVSLPLVATSVLIARVVAIDPRTQLFIAPLVAFYVARGVLVVGHALDDRLGHEVRKGLPTRLLVGTVVLVLLGTNVTRLVMSLTVGSPHHVVGAENARVGEAIRESTPGDATVMSFHPALALFAHRDWRVLPVEPMNRIIRYARTQPNPYLVLSVFYPPELRPAEEPHYLIVPVPEELPEADRWRIDVPEMRRIYAFGELAPVD